MNDDQLKKTLGIEETMQMLEFREMVKSQVTPETYDEAMKMYKGTIQAVMNEAPGSSPLDIADVIVSQLEEDTSLNENERETWKAFIVIAAFEMQEF